MCYNTFVLRNITFLSKLINHNTICNVTDQNEEACADLVGQKNRVANHGRPSESGLLDLLFPTQPFLQSECNRGEIRSTVQSQIQLRAQRQHSEPGRLHLSKKADVTIQVVWKRSDKKKKIDKQSNLIILLLLSETWQARQ